MNGGMGMGGGWGMQISQSGFVLTELNDTWSGRFFFFLRCVHAAVSGFVLWVSSAATEASVLNIHALIFVLVDPPRFVLVYMIIKAQQRLYNSSSTSLFLLDFFIMKAVRFF